MQEVKALREEYSAILKQANIDSPQLSTDILLTKALGYTSIHELRISPNLVVNKNQYTTFLSLIHMRILGMPIAYIIGEKDFLSSSFIVSPATLIPRPETEEFVEYLIDIFLLQEKKERQYILDIGTGSGCIPCSLAQKTSNTLYYALDISQDALDIASINAKRLGVENNIDFICGDLYALPFKANSFTSIISNPPYIATEEYKELSKEVAGFEPYTALVSGETGLEAIFSVIDQSYVLLKENGYLYMEIGYLQKKDIEEYCIHSYWKSVIFRKDLSQKNRFLIAQK